MILRYSLQSASKWHIGENDWLLISNMGIVLQMLLHNLGYSNNMVFQTLFSSSSMHAYTYSRFSNTFKLHLPRIFPPEQYGKRKLVKNAWSCFKQWGKRTATVRMHWWVAQITSCAGEPNWSVGEAPLRHPCICGFLKTFPILYSVRVRHYKSAETDNVCKYRGSAVPLKRKSRAKALLPIIMPWKLSQVSFYPVSRLPVYPAWFPAFCARDASKKLHTVRDFSVWFLSHVS